MADIAQLIEGLSTRPAHRGSIDRAQWADALDDWDVRPPESPGVGQLWGASWVGRTIEEVGDRSTVMCWGRCLGRIDASAEAAAAIFEAQGR